MAVIISEVFTSLLLPAWVMTYVVKPWKALYKDVDQVD